jgi:hypothetical protein
LKQQNKYKLRERKNMKQATKPVSLPEPIDAYFAADGGGGGAVSLCFNENAVVKDEGHTYKGRDAIQAWKTDVSAKYQYTTEPFAYEEKDGKILVTSHVAGNFPGSPIDIRYSFKLEDGKIESLEISA